MKKHRNALVRKVCANIRALREKTGLSQERFAFEYGIERSYYGSIERGKANITIAKLDLIAKALKINPAYLLK